MEGVFTKRGEAEVADSTILGAFDEVFVRRGRWRKSTADAPQQGHPDMVDLADRIECSLSDPDSQSNYNVADSANPCKDHHVINVKNTFVHTVLDFDSLQDFLKERQVKSCPASRQGSSVTTMLLDDLLAKAELNINVESNLREEVLNTASSLGDLACMFVTQKEDDVISMPSGSTVSGDSESPTNEEVLNTASSFGDLDPEMLRCRMAEVDEPNVVNDPLKVVDEANLDDQALKVTSQDRLRSLRMMGSAIQERISPSEIQQVPAEGTGAAVGQQPAAQAPNQWLVSVQTPEGIRPGVVTLLGSVQPDQQTQFATPHRSEPLPVKAMGMPMVAPPPAAPVLRLADSIAPPELGTPELPSIGSMLHRTGECKPCTFFHTRGCENEKDCKFCHLCGPREKKKRIKAQKAAQREADFIALQNGLTALARFRAAEEEGRQVDMIIE